ncbi:Small auxin-up RNA protein [Dioscorea alata]|uniref:Small auxin-up RNA protein n=1 Tax=Dioscorea alata TaxID=55571 RepID=A0ACB7WV50_DIOAL|nr:Small auxin-up RNA protein [Dioscorea alata]
MISSPRANKRFDFNECSTSSVAEKGHFFVYTSEGKRYMVPLAYLENNIFKELLKISEENLGCPAMVLSHCPVMRYRWSMCSPS